MSRQYNRVFITLKQERGDYSLPSKQSLGKCVIESRGSSGKLSVYAQDIKPHVIYKIYLIAGDVHESKGLPVGTLALDQKGKGELKWEFEADNVGATGLPIEKFNTVALVVQKGGELLTVLSGFTEDEVLWKNNFVDVSEKPKEQAAAKAKSPVETPIDKSATSKEESASAETETIKTAVHSTANSENNYATSGDFFDGGSDLIAAHEVFKKVIEDLDEKIEKLSGTAYVFANHVEMNPFPEEGQSVKWARITLKDLILFTEQGYEYMTHPFIVQSYQKYKHLMAGEHLDSQNQKRHILAIPDVYDAKFKTMAEELGFDEFKFSGDNYGYWLCSK